MCPLTLFSVSNKINNSKSLKYFKYHILPVNFAGLLFSNFFDHRSYCSDLLWSVKLIATIFADPENDYLHLDDHVTYADVIIVCFHDTLYQLKYFGQQIRRQPSLTENLHMSLIRCKNTFIFYNIYFFFVSQCDNLLKNHC